MGSRTYFHLWDGIWTLSNFLDVLGRGTFSLKDQIVSVTCGLYGFYWDILTLLQQENSHRQYVNKWSCVCVLSRVQLFAAHGLWPAKILCPWNFSGKNNGVSCRFLLQELFLSQGSMSRVLCLLHWQVDLLPLGPPGSWLCFKFHLLYAGICILYNFLMFWNIFLLFFFLQPFKNVLIMLGLELRTGRTGRQCT